MNKLISLVALCISTLLAIMLPALHLSAQTDLIPQLAQQATPTQLRSTELSSLKTSKYVATDINGNTYDIEAILKSGKAILIDFSTEWCNPCWKLHQSGVLEKIYHKFGPKGSNQLELFWVETDGASLSKIRDPKKDWTKDSKGNPVPYPVFSDAHMASTLGLPVSLVPALYLIGPADDWIECDEAVKTKDPNFTQLAQLLTLFLTADDKPDRIQIQGPTDLYLGDSQAIRLSYKTVAPATDIRVEAPEGISIAKVSDSEYKLTPQKVGIYPLTVSISNKNGKATRSFDITVSEAISAFPFSCGMDTKDVLDKGWRSIDHDGDGFGFDSFKGWGFWDRLGIPLKDPNTPLGAENSSDCLVSWGQLLPMKMNGDIVLGPTIQPNNELLSAPLAIPADAQAPTFSCYISCFLGSTGNMDQLKVMVTELNGTPTQVLAPQTSTNEWRLISTDLSAYKGKTIFISLIPVVNGTSGISVDQIRVTMDGSTDVETPSLNLQTTIYPNPATEFITVQTKAGSTIELFAADGTLASTAQTTEETTTVSVAQLPSGRYIARITSADGEVVLRPVIIR